MPASTASPAYQVVAELAPEAEPEDHARLRDLLQAFLSAIDFGFFDDNHNRPARLVAESVDLRTDNGRFQLSFAAEHLPHAAFTILAGMFVGHAAHLGIPIASTSARQKGFGELLKSPGPSLSPLAKLPFATEVPVEGPAHKALRIWIDFVGPLAPALGDELVTLFATWDALVLGPFPADQRPVGDSWIGPSQTSFLMPERVEHASEDFESGPAAFDVLLRALLRFHERAPIESVEIE